MYQITCSPINNTVPLLMRLVFNVGWSNTVERLTRALGRVTRVPPLPIHWHHPSGPHFGNTLALLVFDGDSARVRLERSIRVEGTDEHESGVDMALTEDMSLTEAPRVIT